ncbi:FLA8 protein [Gonium pectorale]|uniref:Kinesin-like protein n=1 Tax=Gonium pectorale TaxID=33097 RepID=A0A150H0R4_GONPE|nr:FLA8 protein [Gonium pectorale]|eukprot:KXZ55756.1 FLA8 protein [Gonium pectorale]
MREVTLYQNVGGKQMSRTFRFDKVFSSDAGQEKLYKQAIIPIVQEVMEGFNCTIFAYGQTGTGKTYTMEGGPRRSDDGKSLSAEAGVIPRSIKQIFDHIEANNTDSTVKVTFLELYNEELTDLLSFDDVKDDSKRLRLLEDRNGVVAQGLEEVVVKSATEIYQVLDRGTAKRRTAETLLNKRSSRSHSVFSITIHMREVTPEGEDVVKVGKLNLVDLAGSENISRSGAKDGRAREAGSINQSLLTLGRVITALVEHSGHVPYRDSKLTRLLRESLGGKTKTCIIATIAPTVHCQEETISTLDYAHRAKNIRNRPEVNQKISKTAMIKEMSSEMEKLRQELVAQRERNGVYVPTERYQQDELERVQLRDQVKALREEMKLEREEFEQQLEKQKVESERTIKQLEEKAAGLKTDIEYMESRLQEASRTIHERQFVIAAHRQAEEDIAEHAEALRLELEAAIRDIRELFTSMTELSGMHGGDRDAMRRTQQLTRARLESLSSSLTSAVDKQRQQLQDMSASLLAFKAQKEQDLRQLTARTDNMQTTITSMLSTVQQRAQEADSAAASVLQGASNAVATHSADAMAAAQRLDAATRSAVEALALCMDEQTQQLLSFAQEQAALAASARDSLKSNIGRLSQGFNGVRETACEGQRDVDCHTAELNNEFGGFIAQCHDELEREQTLLAAKIAEMLQAFAKDRASQVARGVEVLQRRVQQGNEVVKGRLSQIAQASTAGTQDAQASVRM